LLSVLSAESKKNKKVLCALSDSAVKLNIKITPFKGFIKPPLLWMVIDRRALICRARAASRRERKRMKIERFEDIEAWQLARELTRKVYDLTKKTKFARDFGLRGQIQDAAGSSMHNIAEGFDSETNPEFVRFLRYAKRSCTEVQSELYMALDQQYITDVEFKDVYDHAGRTRATIRGFINYLVAYQQDQQKKSNLEPLNAKR
jgi:four helix bundle protein